MQRGTRARARLFHALISDNFDSELELQKQALALNMPIAATGYVAVVSKLVVGKSDGARGGEALGQGAASPDVPRGALHHLTHPATPRTLSPAQSPAPVDGARPREPRAPAAAGGGGSARAAPSTRHRHTVLYRLDKLREILGGELDTPASRLRLQLALDLRKLI